MKKKLDPLIESLILEPKTREMIAKEYGVSVNTLKGKLEAEKITLPPGLIFPVNQKIIYYALGMPPYLKTSGIKV